MKVIRLSKKAFNNLDLLDIPREILNTEGKVYNFLYRKEPKVFKQLYHQQGLIFASKLYTLEMLDNNREFLPENFYIPDYLVTVGDTIEGFTVPYSEGINLALILKSKMNCKEHIYYLKKVGDILEQMNNIRTYTPLTDFYLNDLHEGNFIVNPKKREINVVDLDSCKIGDNMVFASHYLTPLSLLNNINKYHVISEEKNNYHTGYVYPDENSDLYCYSMMILNYLYGSNVNNLKLEEYYEYLNYLEYIGVNRDLISIFEKLLVNASNENPVDYLNSLNEEQIYRSRKSVYERCLKK